ncbi:MAG: hypothetical protein R2713_16485 [Ilumatobacteraceae bacterium]
MYDANNVSAGEATGGGPRPPPHAPTSWTTVPYATYEKSNTTGDSSDGWRSYKVCLPLYDDFDDNGAADELRDDRQPGRRQHLRCRGRVRRGDPRGGPYTNAAAADLFVLPNYANFGNALSAVALGQCGGTVTMQTRVQCLDRALPRIRSRTRTPRPTRSCRRRRRTAAARSTSRSPVAPRPRSPSRRSSSLTSPDTPAGFRPARAVVSRIRSETAPVDGHAPWTAIRLTVNVQAVSCIQQVVLT